MSMNEFRRLAAKIDQYIPLGVKTSAPLGGADRIAEGAYVNVIKHKGQ
jgi:hypothetical protein